MQHGGTLGGAATSQLHGLILNWLMKMNEWIPMMVICICDLKEPCLEKIIFLMLVSKLPGWADTNY